MPRLFTSDLRQLRGQRRKIANGTAQFASGSGIERDINPFRNRCHISGDATGDRRQLRDVGKRGTGQDVAALVGFAQLPQDFFVASDRVPRRHRRLPLPEQARLVEQHYWLVRQPDRGVELEADDDESSLQLHPVYFPGLYAAHHDGCADPRAANINEPRAGMDVSAPDARTLRPHHATSHEQEAAEHGQSDGKVGRASHGSCPSNQNVAKRASSTRIVTAEWTTAAVAAAPTPCAPPRAFMPSMHPIQVMTVPKLAAFTRPYCTSKVLKKSRIPFVKSAEVRSSSQVEQIQPAAIPTNIAIPTMTGNMMVPATTRGTTRYACGSYDSVSSASICSVTRIVPSSAAMLAPTRPASARPVSTGASSIVMVFSTSVPTK